MKPDKGYHLIEKPWKRSDQRKPDQQIQKDYKRRSDNLRINPKRKDKHIPKISIRPYKQDTQKTIREEIQTGLTDHL